MEEGSFNTGRQQVTPYNTGKVLIGCRYEVPATPLTDEEMHVQHALLGPGKTGDGIWNIVVDLVVGISAIAFFTWMLR